MGGNSLGAKFPAPPADAPAMHDRLDELGVVTRVDRILRRDRETVADVTNLLCWVERGTGADEAVVFVWAAFTEHPTRQAEAKRPFAKRAHFGVRPDARFGTPLDDPLPNVVVRAIYDLEARHTR